MHDVIRQSRSSASSHEDVHIKVLAIGSVRHVLTIPESERECLKPLLVAKLIAKGQQGSLCSSSNYAHKGSDHIAHRA